MPLRGQRNQAPSPTIGGGMSAAQQAALYQQALYQQQLAFDKQRASLVFAGGYNQGNPYGSGYGGYGGGGFGGGGYDPAQIAAERAALQRKSKAVGLSMQNALAANRLAMAKDALGAGQNIRSWLGDVSSRGAMTAQGTRQGLEDIKQQAQLAMMGHKLTQKEIREGAMIDMGDINASIGEINRIAPGVGLPPAKPAAKPGIYSPQAKSYYAAVAAKRSPFGG